MKRAATIALTASLALSMTGCISLTPVEKTERADSEQAERLSDTGGSRQEEALDLALTLGPASMNCPSSWTIEETGSDATAKTAAAEDASATALISMTDFGTQLSEEEKQTALEVFVQSMTDIEGVSMGNTQETSIDGVSCISFAYTVSGETDIANMEGIAFAQGSAIYLCTVGYKDDSNKDLAGRILSTLTIVDSSSSSPQAQAPEPAPEPDPVNSSGSYDAGTEALTLAFQYLESSPFSKDMLVKQLEYEGFSTEDAVWAVDLCGADWDAEAVRMAEFYLDGGDIPRDELITYLENDGFPHDQAVYGVDEALN